MQGRGKKGKRKSHTWRKSERRKYFTCILSLLMLFYIALFSFIESLRLEKTSKIKFHHQPNTTMPAKPYPEVPYIHVF